MTARFSWWLVSTIGGASFFFIILPARATRVLPLWVVLLLLFLAMRFYLAAVQVRLDRLVGRRRRDLDAEIAQLTESAATLQTTEELGRAVDRFLRALDRRLAALVVIEPSGPRVAASARGAVPAPERTSPLFAELLRARTLSSRLLPGGQRRIEIERACVRWGAEYLAPLIDGENLLGIVAITAKAGGRRRDALEREALDRMSVTITAALASASLFERLRALSHELEEKAEARQRSLSRTLRDLRGAEQRLVQSEKLAGLGQIVGGVAADLADEVRGVAARCAEVRAHVETFRGAIEARLAADPALADRELHEMVRDLGPIVDSIGEGSRRALLIAQDLLRFAPAGAEAPLPERAPARLDELCDATLKLCAAHTKGLTVVREYDAALPPVLVETGPLGQVVLNLVLNATHAMRDGGTLTLATRRSAPGSDSVELVVRDTGPGILPEHLPRIFEPFFSTKTQTHGTGLGLSVSYGIVDRHGGRILVESRVGAGSTFRVQLPLQGERQ